MGDLVGYSGRAARIAAATFVLAAAAGCTSVPRGAGFGEVHDAVLARTGGEVQWQGDASGGAAAAAIAGRARQLLGGELTAERAVAVAFLENLGLQATLEELGVARADLLEAGLLRNPLVELEVRFPASPATPFEAAVAQPVLDLFLRPVRKRVAAAAFAAARLRVTDAVLGLAAETRGDFYRLQAAEEGLALVRTIAEAAHAAEELVVRQRQAGTATDLDLAAERAVAQQAELEVARGEIEATAARERLNRDMGLQDDTAAWKVGSHLPPLPPAPDGSLPLAGLEDAAVASRQDLAALHEDARAAARALPAARAAAIALEAQVGAHYERDADGTATTGPAVTAPVPIFNWGQAARARAEARYRQAELRWRARAAEVRSEVRDGWGRLAVARREAELYRDTLVPLSRNVVELTQTQYNAMLAGVFQLLEARKDQARAERGAIDALRDYWLVRTELERAIAARLPALASAAGDPSAASVPQAASPASAEPNGVNHGVSGPHTTSSAVGSPAGMRFIPADPAAASPGSAAPKAASPGVSGPKETSTSAGRSAALSFVPSDRADGGLFAASSTAAGQVGRQPDAASPPTLLVQPPAPGALGGKP